MSDSQQKSIPEKKSEATANTSLASLPAKVESKISIRRNTQPEQKPVSSQAIPASSDKQSEPVEKTPTTQFTTENIGHWKSRQENPFEEQNRKRQAKKQAGDDRLRKSAPYIFAGGILISVVGLVVCLVFLINNIIKQLTPVDYSPGSEEATAVNNEIKNIYNSTLYPTVPKGDAATGEITEGPSNGQKAIEEVSKYIDQKISDTNNNSEKIDLVLIEMQFYADALKMQATVDASKKIDIERGNINQKTQYYSLLSNAYFSLNNDEEGAKYTDLYNSIGDYKYEEEGANY